MKDNAFEILGIENKELQVSNLLSYYFKYQEEKLGIKFLNKFCQVVSIDTIDITKHVDVKREYPIKVNGKNNFIDILIIVGDEKSPERIICIENKVYSTEGFEQTKRYVEALNKEFPMCEKRDYIYLTKDNSSIDLSHHSFKHVRYHDLVKLFTDAEFEKLPLINDFCDYYIVRDKERYESVEEGNKEVSKENYSELIDFIVYKFNRHIEDNKYPFFCARGKSDKSADFYYQLFKLSWNFPKKGYDFTVHFESTVSSLALHFERNPYIPYSKLSEMEIGVYNEIRDKFRKRLTNININGVNENRLHGNACLSIANFTITARTFNEYYSTLFELINYIDIILIDLINNN